MKRLLCLVCLFAWAMVCSAQVAPSILTGPAPQVGDDPLHAQMFAKQGASVGVFLADHAVSYRKTKQRASIGQIVGVYQSYLMSPSGDTTGAKDLAAINAIEAVAGQGATVYWRNGVYYFNGNIAVTATAQSWIGQSSYCTFGAAPPNGTNFPVSPYLSGVVLTEVEAATDAVAFSGTAASINLYNIGVMFGSSIGGNTGNGINCTPSATYETGHQTGLTNSYWYNVHVYGVDGNHHAFVLENQYYDTFDQTQWWVGGGWYIGCDSAYSNMGNSTWIHPTGFMDEAGTANAFDLASASSAQPGLLNLLAFYSPGVQLVGAAQLNGQMIWNDYAGGSNAPAYVLVDNPDFEPTVSLCTFTCTEGVTIPVATDVYSSSAFKNLTVLSASVVSGHWQIIGTCLGTLTSTGTLGYVSGPGSPDASIAYSAVTVQPQFDYGTGTWVRGGVNPSTYLLNSFDINSGNQNATGYQDFTRGYGAGKSLTTGANDYFAAADAGESTTTGANDLAIGSLALKNNTGGANIIAIGASAAEAATSGGTAVVIGGAISATHIANMVEVGYEALNSATATNAGEAFGAQTLLSQSSGTYNDVSGYQGGYNPGGGTNTANATITGSQITGMGDLAGNADTGDYSYTTWLGFESLVKGNYATALGWKTEAGAAGAVAIGVDHTGTSASTTTQDRIALGTSNHTVYIAGATTHVGTVTQQGAIVETPVGETASFTTGSAAFYNITGTTASQTATMIASPTAGMHVTITNHASQSWTVAPNTGQAINQTTWASGASTVHTGSLTLAAGAKVTLYTPDGVNWDCE